MSDNENILTDSLFRKGSVGTLEWANKTGGRLSSSDLRELDQQRALLKMQAQAKLIKSRVNSFSMNDHELSLPDSAGVNRAFELLRTIGTDWMVQHCIRTFLWGKYLAGANEIRFDEEILLIASLFHDLGLTEEHQSGVDSEHCYSVTGARLAKQELMETEWTNQQVEAVQEAITLHLNVLVPVGQGPEAHLLHAGASLDSIGTRWKEVDSRFVERVFDSYPRGDAKQAMVQCCHFQTQIRPQSRIAALMERGFDKMVLQCPE